MLELSYDFGAGDEEGALLSGVVVSYLFLGGAGAGLVLVLCVLGLLAPADARARAAGAYRSLLGAGFACALVVLALGVVCLLADLGNVDRAVLLLMQPHPTYLTVGAWALAVCWLLALLLALAWLGLAPLCDAAVRVVEAAVVVVAIVVMVYTGLLLQSLGAVPLWASPWLPALFVASSLSCGIALLLTLSQFTGASRTFATVLRRLAALDAVVIVVEACIVAAFVFVAFAGGAAPSNGTEQALALSVRDLIDGRNAWLFWSCFVGFGLAVPFVLDLILAQRRSPLPGTALFAAACVLAGGFAMRFCVVAAGAHPVLSSIGVM